MKKFVNKNKGDTDVEFVNSEEFDENDNIVNDDDDDMHGPQEKEEDVKQGFM